MLRHAFAIGPAAVKRRFCNACITKAPCRTANLAPVKGKCGPIGISRSASIQDDQRRQTGDAIQLIRPGISDGPEIIGVFAGADIDASGIKAGAAVEIEFTSSRLEIGITGINAR